MAIIYKHTSPSGKSYIGMTNQTIEERLKGHIIDRNKYIKEFEANSEPEAVFKACEWILENKNKGQ